MTDLSKTKANRRDFLVQGSTLAAATTLVGGQARQVHAAADDFAGVGKVHTRRDVDRDAANRVLGDVREEGLLTGGDVEGGEAEAVVRHGARFGWNVVIRRVG